MLTVYMCITQAFFIPTLRKNGALMVVFGSLTCTFFLLAGGHWSESCDKAAGYVGFFCGCSAIYTAIAEIYHENLGECVAVVSLDWGRMSLSGLPAGAYCEVVA